MKRMLILFGVVPLLSAFPAHGQTLTRAELTEALKQRDDVIAALQARVAALEQQAARGMPGTMVAAPAGAPPNPEMASAARADANDDDNVQALSQTLLDRGGLVLAPWQSEVILSASYSNRVVQGLALVQTPEGIPTVADQRLREDQIRGSLGLRLGLPLASQIDVQLPYNWIRRARALGDGTTTRNIGSGVGDVDVALSHQFLTEKDRRPAVIGGVSWRFRTGRDPFRIPVSSVATGSGSDELRGRVTVVKSSDPLVFFGTLSYAHNFPAHEPVGTVQIGDSIGLQLGMALALNPDTSMTFGLNQDFRGRTRLDGQFIAGTDTQSSSLQIGVGRNLTPNLLFDVSLGVGLTRDAPDYVFQISLPFRFR